MATRESDQEIALRIKAKMERYGYTPTIEGVLASVAKACSKDIDEVKRRIRLGAVGHAVDRMDRGAKLEDVEELVSPEAVDEAAAEFMRGHPECTAWTDYLQKLAQDTGRDYHQLRAELRTRKDGGGLFPWEEDVSSHALP